MVLVGSFICATNMVVVLLTSSNHSCIITTYIKLFLSVQGLSVVYSCLVEDLSKED